MFLINGYVVTLVLITFITIVGIMVILATATSVEIPMNFLGIDLARSVAPAVRLRFVHICLRLHHCGLFLFVSLTCVVKEYC